MIESWENYKQFVYRCQVAASRLKKHSSDQLRLIICSDFVNYARLGAEGINPSPTLEPWTP